MMGDVSLKGRVALFFGLALVGVLLDLTTKSYVFDWLYDPAEPWREPHWFVQDVFGFQCSHNPGALFGIGKGLHWLFAIFSFVAIGGVLCWLFLFGAARDLWITIALGFVTGGILGNLYDRLGFGWLEGYPETTVGNVRDFIHFKWQGVWPFDPWPNFNIADSLLVTGAIMLFIHAIFLADVPNEPTDKTGADEKNSETRLGSDGHE